jgi:ATP-binding cassette subfamily C (CFTR/MRP) protein 1
VRKYNNALLPLRQETINGLTTVRAFGETERFQDKCHYNTDFFLRTIMCQATIGRWLEVRLQALGGVTLFCTALAISLFPGLLDAGMAGLALNYSVQATGTLRGENTTIPVHCASWSVPRGLVVS